jgi:hypothetical protein
LWVLGFSSSKTFEQAESDFATQAYNTVHPGEMSGCRSNTAVELAPGEQTWRHSTQLYRYLLELFLLWLMSGAIDNLTADSQNMT